MKNREFNRCNGFTMLEIMIAIVILILLAGIAMVAYRGALNMFGTVTARNEMNVLESALEMYKTQYGEYPPDGCSENVIKRHILKRWPDVLKERNLVAKYLELVPRTPHESLLFWLCGPPRNTDGNRGFTTNPKEPFGIDASGANPVFLDSIDHRDTPILDVKYDTTNDGCHSGNCNGVSFTFKDVPIVYFRAEKGGYTYSNPLAPFNGDTVPKQYEVSGFGLASPYMKSGKWYKDDSYQLLLPGEDGSFGGTTVDANVKQATEKQGSYYWARDLADSSTYSKEDEDNITNISEGNVLLNEIEKN